MRHDRRVIQLLIAPVLGLHVRGLVTLAVGAFLLTGLFATEGVGLWLGKRWGQYLTVVATTLFVPLEIERLARVVTVTRVAALLLNLAVVAFLVYRLGRRTGSEPVSPTQVTPPLYLPRSRF